MSDDVLAIPVYYDFASTICYVAHRVMGRIAAELEATGLGLEWRPVDLTMIAGWRRGVAVEGPRRDNALRVARDLGVAAHMPARWLDSRPAHAVTLALADTAKEIAWRERVWTAVFDEGRAVENDAEVARLADDLGIDLEALSLSRGRRQLEIDTQRARAAGVTGVPTFLLGVWPMGGIQDEATMRSLLRRFAQKQREAEEQK